MVKLCLGLYLRTLNTRPQLSLYGNDLMSNEAEER